MGFHFLSVAPFRETFDGEEKSVFLKPTTHTILVCNIDHQIPSKIQQPNLT